MTDELNDEFPASDVPQAQTADLDRQPEAVGVRSSGSVATGALILARIRAVGYATATAPADALIFRLGRCRVCGPAAD
jgi:hypothetical protein